LVLLNSSAFYSRSKRRKRRERKLRCFFSLVVTLFFSSIYGLLNCPSYT